MHMHIYILALMISTLDLACVLRKALVSSLSKESWQKLFIHMSQGKLGLVTGILTLQLVVMMEVRK